MRIAILSGIHGNITALEAVVADLRRRAPDLALHGGACSPAYRRALMTNGTH